MRALGIQFLIVLTQSATKERLIIFTRYPEAGKTKTRLIPALGVEGAARLQRQMTEDTLKQARELQSFRSTDVEIHFAGGTQQLMQAWLGSNLIYHPQCEGDLGERLTSALETSFAAGMTRVAVIGIDCPDLNAEVIDQAFDMLNRNDLVLGPAEDGGYYLIGLRRLIPELFMGISWSTAEVFRETVKIAERLELAITYLPLLNDIDRPEDVPS